MADKLGASEQYHQGYKEYESPGLIRPGIELWPQGKSQNHTCNHSTKSRHAGGRVATVNGQIQHNQARVDEPPRGLQYLIIGYVLGWPRHWCQAPSDAENGPRGARGYEFRS